MPFPKVINSKMIRQMAEEGMAAIRGSADEYNAAKGLAAPTHGVKPTPVNPSRGKSLATAFEEMPHAPNDPAVRQSYEALSKETVDQFKHLQKSGLKVSPIPAGKESPYKTSTDVFNDIHQNKHLWYYPTEQGFGSGGIQDNPLLKQVDIDGKQVPVNDLFRIVHDYYGHAKEGYKFGPTGEEAAWKQHLQMFSPEAQKAMTTETRGQNSWVNFGPHGEANRANPANTKYAEQKTGLLPPWAMEPNGAPSKYSEPRGVLQQSPTSSEIVVPQPYTNKQVSLSGSTPEEALTAYQTMYGKEAPNVTPNPEALSKRLAEAKAAQNMLKPEDATQVLTSSDIRKLAGLGGAAVVGASMMTPDEANAAGVGTIMERMKVGLEEAKKIKQLAAQRLPQDVFEKNIEAIRTVKDYKKNPFEFEKLGSGADYIAKDAGNGQVLKVPMRNTETNPTIQAAPALLHYEGLGPQTKNITVGDKQYMLQDKVTPFSQIRESASRHGEDPELEQLYTKLDKTWQKKGPDFDRVNDEIENQITQRKLALYKEQGIDEQQLLNEYKNLTPQERAKFHQITGLKTNTIDPRDMDLMFEKIVQNRAHRKMGHYITPMDLHEGNIGLNNQGQPTIFDSSRFEALRPQQLTPEQRQAILDSNIMSPASKAELKAHLENGPEDFGTVSDETFTPVNGDPNWTKNSKGDWIRKVDWGAAGAAGAMGAGALGGNRAEAMEQIDPLPKIGTGIDWYKQNVQKPVSEASEQAGRYITNLTTPLQGSQKQQFVNENAPMVGGIINPTNYVPYVPEAEIGAEAFSGLREKLRNKPEDEEDNTLP